MTGFWLELNIRLGANAGAISTDIVVIAVDEGYTPSGTEEKHPLRFLADLESNNRYSAQSLIMGQITKPGYHADGIDSSANSLNSSRDLWTSKAPQGLVELKVKPITPFAPRYVTRTRHGASRIFSPVKHARGAADRLYGLTTLQTYQYFRTSSADPYLFKATGHPHAPRNSSRILDTVHEVLIVQSLWTYVIVDFGNTTAINTPTKCLQGFMEYILKRSCFPRLSLVRLTSMVFNWSLNITGERSRCDRGNLNSFAALRHLSIDLYVGIGSAAAADIVIAGSQVFLLLKHRTGFRRCGLQLSVRLHTLISRGSVVAVACFVTFAAMPNTFVYLALYNQLPKCTSCSYQSGRYRSAYDFTEVLINAYLATLNAREDLRQISNGGSDMISIPLSGLNTTSDNIFTSRNQSRIRSETLAVSVETSKTVVGDV
ncbi:hypothetical protein IEO21_07889 [Rhodonia placenta]|uniref:DUF6534 domain-containing protein n=1 Tax=Rhodonia placenta TaxID=104341 RepID=A0A8H7TZC3_9APHY|nr:hypothetical protein IEO21_07889 [Postia placenta]